MPFQLQISSYYPSWRNAKNFEANRLRTFNRWSKLHNSPVSSLTLAKDGYFLPSNCDQVVRCYSCGVTRSEWQRGDNVRTFHSSDCRRLQLEGDPRTDVKPNIPIPTGHHRDTAGNAREDSNELNAFRGVQETGQDADASLLGARWGVTMRGVQARNNATALGLIRREPDGSLPFTARVEVFDGPVRGGLYPQYSTEEQRCRTFRTFPRVGGRLDQKLIEHGFFYVGHEDIVFCFWCGLVVHEWMPNDEPAYVHSMWSPHCEHARAMERNEFIELTNRSVVAAGYDN